MVIDTSAAVAILLGEAERDEFIAAIASDQVRAPNPDRLMSAVNALESAIVMEARKGAPGGRNLTCFCIRLRSPSYRCRQTMSKKRAPGGEALERAIIQRP